MSNSQTENKTPKYTVVLDSKNQTLLGFFAILLFLTCWFASIGSPIILFFLLKNARYIEAVLLVIFVGVGYLPIKLNRTCRKLYGQFSSQYFKHTTMTYEEGADILDKNKKTMVAVHPHGITCMAWNIVFGRPEFEGVKMCFSATLNQGFFRFVSKLVGQPSSVDRKTMCSHMKQGKRVTLIPGGFEEASLFKYGQEQAYLKTRAGFVKLALQFGYSLTPVYGFKECFSYYNVQGFDKFKLFLNKYGIPGAIPFGFPLIPLLPRRDCEVHVVVGKSMELPRIENPTKEEVQKYHQLYVQEVLDLFDRHKGRFYENPQDIKLEII